jgi:vacuolar-type H+-ATPase subunit H
MSAIAKELLRFDRDAAALYDSTLAEREGIIREAKARALTIVQEAARERGQEREHAIREKDAALKALKATIRDEANREAERLRTQAAQAQPSAVAHVLAALQEELAQ